MTFGVRNAAGGQCTSNRFRNRGAPRRGHVVTEWFVQTESDAELGPLRPSELLALVRSGKVTRQTLVRSNNSSWVVAGDVGGLFEAALRPTIQYLCPQCENEVSEPPVRCTHCGRKIHRGITRIIEHGSLQPASAPLAQRYGSARRNGATSRWLSNRGDDLEPGGS